MSNEKYIYRNTFRLTNSDVDVAYYEILTRLMKEKNLSFNGLVKLALIELDKKDTSEAILKEVNVIINNKLDEYFGSRQSSVFNLNESEKTESELSTVDNDQNEEVENMDNILLQNFMENFSYQG